MAGHADREMPLPEFDEAPRILVVIAAYYGDVSDAQLSAARAVLDEAGAAHETMEVPGSLEIPTAIGIAHRQGEFDGYVALGCVIRGATSHYDIVIAESARGLTMLGLTGVCIGNGIITVETREQAMERADAERLNTAGGAAAAALHLVSIQQRTGKKPSSVGFTHFAGGTHTV